MLASNGEITAPCGVADGSWCHLPVFLDASCQPFTDQPDHPPVADTVFDEADQPLVADRVKEPRDIGVQYPVHLAAVDANRQGVQRIVRAAPRPESMAEPKEVSLPDGVQYFHQRALDDLVFQRRDTQRPLPPVGLRNEDPPGRPRPVRTAMDAAVKVFEPTLQSFAIRIPRHPIHPGRCLFLQPAIGGPR